MTIMVAVVTKNKSKIQKNNGVFTLHTTWEFVCVQINSSIFQKLGVMQIMTHINTVFTSNLITKV